MRVAVLASGEGTNLQALLDRVHGRDGIAVVAAASDKPAAHALERARSAAVATSAFPIAAMFDRKLFSAAAKHLVDHKFDLKALMRAILQSKIYQRSSRPLPENAADTRFYSHYYARRLPADIAVRQRFRAWACR